MNWSIWLKIDELLERLGINPIIAVIPNNRDRTFYKEKEKENFWDYIKEKQKRGWIIGMHGYQHLCITRSPGIMTNNSCSEFAGLSEEEQERKIVKALEIFKTNNVKPDLFIAPFHSFDYTTLHVLRKYGINVISDGFFLYPGLYYDVLWLPQQLWNFPKVPPPLGVWTILFHHNFWSSYEENQFKEKLLLYKKRIGDPREAISRYEQRKVSSFDKIFNYTWRKILSMRARLGTWI
jgi:peptidoglycan/xylan/chitin deacetylase (PgdA/CDA1 family)